jgi:hypothetical protein
MKRTRYLDRKTKDSTAADPWFDEEASWGKEPRKMTGASPWFDEEAV